MKSVEMVIAETLARIADTMQTHSGNDVRTFRAGAEASILDRDTPLALARSILASIATQGDASSVVDALKAVGAPHETETLMRRFQAAIEQRGEAMMAAEALLPAVNRDA